MSTTKKTNTMSSSVADVAPSSAPDSEVRAVAKRRQFSAAYKLALLEEAERLNEPGAIGALLRREGLYSSHLSMWRREREGGALQALSRRGRRKPKQSAEQKRVATLEARCARLQRELDQAHTIIEVQKKLCTLLGLPTAAGEPNTGSDS
jgi:transposase